jgi:hypothetical protein
LEKKTMLKSKLSLAAILSTTAIASGIVLGSVSSAQSCLLRKLEYKQEQYEAGNWLRSPWIAILVLPGIALATALSVGDRLYKKDSNNPQ